MAGTRWQRGKRDGITWAWVGFVELNIKIVRSVATFLSLSTLYRLTFKFTPLRCGLIIIYKPVVCEQDSFVF